MAWIRKGDEWNSAPEWMRAHELAATRGDDRLVNELKGAAEALYTYSAQQWTDYIVGYGAAVHNIGLTRVEPVLIDLMKIGVIMDVSADGQRKYQLLERATFVHIIRSDEKKKKAKRKRDQNRAALQVPVLLRDGDECRYCGVEVKWGDTRSEVGRELDHRNIDDETTPENYVVSCRECNQMRRDLGDAADTELPLLGPPGNPIYGPELLKKISTWAPTVKKICRQLGIQNPLEPMSASVPATSRATDLQPLSTPASGLAVNQSARDPQFPKDSPRVESQGRAAQEPQPHPATSTVSPTESPSISLPKGLSGHQPERDPRPPHRSHVRDSGAVNEQPNIPARKRRRRRR